MGEVADRAEQSKRRTRLLTAVQLIALIALTVIVLPAVSPGAAVRGGPWIKTLFLCRIVLLLLAATCSLWLRGLRWSDVGLQRPRWWRFAAAIPLGLFAGVIAVSVVKVLLASAGVHAADYTMFGPVRGNITQYLFWLIPVTWISAAFGEEILFRGFVLDALERIAGGPGKWTTPAVILLQSALFGVVHLYQGVGGAATAGTIGLVLGFVWLFSGRNLWSGIVIHGLFDSSAMTAIFLGATSR